MEFPVINVDNGFLDVVTLPNVSNLEFVGVRVGDGVAVVNDKEVLEADECIGLNMIDVLLSLSQKMIYTGPVPNCMVFVVMILCPVMICTGVVVGVFVFKEISVLNDVDGSKCLVKGDVVMFLVKKVVSNRVENFERLFRDEGLFEAEADEGLYVEGDDVLLLLVENVVFNNGVLYVIWDAAAVW